MSTNAGRAMVTADLRGSALVLAIRAASRRNALSSTVRQQIHEGLDAAERDPRVRAVVVCGEPGIFSSGGDITEDFARVRPQVVERIVRDLGADRLHVLYVVRRLDRLLPSQWQQRTQGFKRMSYDAYLAMVLDPTGRRREHRAFWAAHDVTAVVDRWAAQVGPERCTVVVVEQGADAADRWIAERIGPGDLCVTADVPLAAACVERGARALAPNGAEMTARNVGERLAMRDLMADLRAADPFRQGGGRPFSAADRSRFLEALDRLLRTGSDPKP